MEWIFLQDESLTQEFYVENCVEVWTRNRREVGYVCKEIGKRDFFILMIVICDFLVLSNAVEKLNKHCFEDVMVLYLCLDDKCNWSIVVSLLLSLRWRSRSCCCAPLCFFWFYIEGIFTSCDIRNWATFVSSVWAGSQIRLFLRFTKKRVKVLIWRLHDYPIRISFETLRVYRCGFNILFSLYFYDLGESCPNSGQRFIGCCCSRELRSLLCWCW